MRRKTGWNARRERVNSGILPPHVRRAGRKRTLSDGRRVYAKGPFEYEETTERGSGVFVRKRRQLKPK